MRIDVVSEYSDVSRKSETSCWCRETGVSVYRNVVSKKRGDGFRERGDGLKKRGDVSSKRGDGLKKGGVVSACRDVDLEERDVVSQERESVEVF